MKTLDARTLAAFGTLFWLVACNEIAGIHEPTLRGEGGAPTMSCSTVADCTVEEPECRTASCKGGACVFHDEPEGKLLSEQATGDCVERVCDGAGNVRISAVDTDLPDDGNPCTLDTCEGTTPKHTIQAQAPCYEGAPETLDVGDCKGGVRQCDAQGKLVGECKGQVLPGVETCLQTGDEDCDGKSNEEGQGCVCVPGQVQKCYTGPAGTENVGTCHGGNQICEGSGVSYGPCEDEQTPMAEVCDSAKADENCNGQANEGFATCTCGDGILDAGTEECDDGNTDDTDGCTNACTLPKCGDGITQPGNSEVCDGEPECLPTCKWPTVEMVVAAVAHTCALFSSGRLKCWGYNAYGQLGLGDKSYRGDGPNEMGGDLPAVSLGSGKLAGAIGAGGWHTCALMNDGSVKCWGYNNKGQLGLGNTINRGDNPSEMGGYLPSVSLGAATAISAGTSHTCAVLSGGTVKCWGNNFNGQLGLGDKNQRGDGPGEMGDSLPAVSLGALATAVTVGMGHACALLSGGSVKCWGNNSSGQLGLGDKNNRGDGPGEMGSSLPAVDLGTGKTAKAISAGTSHTCALLTDGTVKCWGYNAHGQLGLGDKNSRGDGPGEMGDSLPAVSLGTGKTAQAISAGANHTCALLNDATVKCWGFNNSGQLGLGDNSNRGDEPGEMGDGLPAAKLFSDAL